MKTTFILSALFAAFVAASPLSIPEVEAVEIEVRQSTTRVQLSRADTDTAVQRALARNSRVSIKNNFGNLGNPVQANRGNIVGSAAGDCKVFKDASAKQLVATLPKNGNFVSFGGNVNLNNGVIVCS